MSLTKKIIKNAFSNGAVFFTEVIVALLMMPFIVHRIGDSAYGIWVLIIAFTGYLGIFKLGLRPAINKYVAQYNALKQYEKMREFLGVTLTIYLISSIFIIIICILFSLVINTLFNIPQQYQEFSKFLVVLIGFHSAFSLFDTAYGGVISGYQRYEINAGIEISVILLRTIIIVIMLPYYSNIYTIIIPHFAITFIGYIITIILARKIAPIKKIQIIQKPPKEAMKQIISFSSISVSIGIVGTIAVNLDTVVIGAILSTAAITHYTVGGRLVKYSGNLLSVLSNVIAPASSMLDARGEITKLKIVIEYAIKISCIIIFPVLTCLIIQGGDFIYLWMGEGYELSYKILILLSVPAFIYLPQQCVNPILYGIAKHKILLILSILQSVVSIPLCVYLGKKIGVEGVAMGIAIPMALIWGVLYQIIWSRYIKIELWRLFINTYVKTAISCLPFGLLLFYAKLYGFTETWVLFLTQLFFGVILYIFSIWLISLNRKDRDKILEVIRPLKNLFSKEKYPAK